MFGWKEGGTKFDEWGVGTRADWLRVAGTSESRQTGDKAGKG